MAPTRHREKRLSLSVPGRQVRQVAASKSEENLGLKINNRSRDTRRTSEEDRACAAVSPEPESLVSLVVCWATLGKHGNFVLKQSSTTALHS